MAKIYPSTLARRAATTKKSKYQTPQELEELAVSEGYTPPKAKTQNPLLRLLGLVTAAETAPAVYEKLRGGSFTKAYAESIGKGITKGYEPSKISYADVLELLGMPEGKLRTIGGLGLDIALDPTTYFGGAIAKGVGKGVVKPVAKLAYKTAKLSTKIPLVEKAAKPAFEGAEFAAKAIKEGLTPGAAIKALPSAMKGGSGFWDENLKFWKGARAAKQDVVKTMEASYKEALSRGINNEDLLKAIENPEAIDNYAVGLKESAASIRKFMDTLFEAEKKSGVISQTSYIDKYLPHMLTPEYRELMKKGFVQYDISKPLRAKLGAAKPRKILGTVLEINKESMEKYGVKMFDDDVFRIMANRGVASVNAVWTKNWIDKVVNRWGIKADPKQFNELIKSGAIPEGVEYASYVPGGQALKFFKTEASPAKDLMYQLENLTQGRSFEQALMQSGRAIKLAEDTGIPISRNNKLRKAFGAFLGKPGSPTGEIFLKSANPITGFHEYGHALDWIFGGGEWQMRLSADLFSNKNLRDEMIKAGREYGGVGAGGKKAEMFAEYFRQYVLDNKVVSQRFPKLTRVVNSYIAAKPEVATRIKSVRKFVNEIDRIIPRAELSKISREMPRWQKAKWQENPEAMAMLEKAVNFFFPSKQGVGVAKVRPTLLPKPIAENLMKTTNFLTDEEEVKNFVKLFDRTMNLWKKSVTSIYPAFHGRNAMGAMFNNWISGLNNPQRYLQIQKVLRGNLDDTLELGGKSYTVRELQGLLKKNGVIGQTGFIDIPQTIEKVLNPTKGLAKLGDVPSSAVGFIEDRVRGALFLDRLAKGDDAWKAAKKVIETHFDYMPEGLTTTERQIMRRIFPFYVWTKNNIMFQLSSMYNKPGKYAAVAKTLRTLQGGTQAEQEQAENLPAYMRKSLPIKIGTSPEGLPEYLYGLGLPVEDLADLSATGMVSKINPLAKAVIEGTTKQHLYYQRPLEEVDSAPKILANAPQPIKNWLEYREETNKQGKTIRKLNPYKWNVVSNLLSRGIFTADRIFDPNVTPLLKVLYGMFGVKGKAVDMESEEYWRERERAQQLQDFLQQKGVLKEFSTYYVPKE